MKAVIRRHQANPAIEPVRELVIGDLCLDLQSYETRKEGRVVQLTPLEFRILYLLAMNAGRVIPYSRLVEYGWGYYGDFDGRDSSLLKTHISHIRAKLDLDSSRDSGIRAIAGVGYSLAKPTGPRQPDKSAGQTVQPAEEAAGILARSWSRAGPNRL
jgi:DNA-binding response OmpR family regulator